MTFAKDFLVEAVDYNALVGQTNTTNPNEINAIWGVGTGNRGYGQTPIDNVSADGSVTLLQWQNLINTVNKLSTHQNSVITPVTAPANKLEKVSFKAGLIANVATLYNNRLNAKYQGDTSQSLTTSGPVAWKQSLTFTKTVTFESGDAARYFFNAGGQIAINLTTPDGDRTDALFYQMTQALGTIVLSGHTSGLSTVVGTSFSGISKLGGTSKGVLTYAQTLGYFGLTTVDQTVYKQGTVTTYHGYTNSSITINMKTNGTQGVNGDNGNVITITVIWDEQPDGIYVSAGSSTTVTVRKPSTAILTNSWGTVTLAGSVTGS